MKRATLAVGVTLIVLAGVAVSLAYWYGAYHGMANDAASATATTADKADPRVLYWHDPMVPGQRFDKPGKSPFMDMQLVPVYADAVGPDTGVTISSRAQQNLGVRTADVVMGALSPEIKAVGSVAWNERDVAVVPARAAGIVEKLHVRAPLDPVAKGQPLAELYVPDWVAAQEEFLSVRRFADATVAPGMAGLADAARQRMRLAGMTDEQIARIEAGGTVQPRVTVLAPIGGVLAEINVREGSAVTMGMPIARINGLSTVWVNAEIPEALAAQVRVGNAVEARTSSGVSARGTIGAVLPDINPATRTLKVRVELANAGRQLVPGMFATLTFRPAARQNALLIPSEALIATGTRNVVMVAQENGTFMPVEVEPGVEANGQVEIRKGLQAGQRVVLSGQFLLDSEASLKGVENRQGAASGRDAAKPAATFRGEGRIEALGKGTVTLDHQSIPAAKMGAMTMEYRAPPQGVPGSVAVGDAVVFEFRQTPEGEFELTSIAPMKSAPGARR